MTRPSICLFCGSRTGARSGHAEAARQTGAMIGRNGWRLVFGAGDVGLMGQVATTALEAVASALGAVPARLLGPERRDRDRTDIVVTEDMHERKNVMFMNSDAVVLLAGALPGS